MSTLEADFVELQIHSVGEPANGGSPRPQQPRSEIGGAMLREFMEAVQGKLLLFQGQIDAVVQQVERLTHGDTDAWRTEAQVREEEDCRIENMCLDIQKASDGNYENLREELHSQANGLDELWQSIHIENEERDRKQARLLCSLQDRLQSIATHMGIGTGAGDSLLDGTLSATKSQLHQTRQSMTVKHEQQQAPMVVQSYLLPAQANAPAPAVPAPTPKDSNDGAINASMRSSSHTLSQQAARGSRHTSPPQKAPPGRLVHTVQGSAAPASELSPRMPSLVPAPQVVLGATQRAQHPAAGPNSPAVVAAVHHQSMVPPLSLCATVRIPDDDVRLLAPAPQQLSSPSRAVDEKQSRLTSVPPQLAAAPPQLGSPPRAADEKQPRLKSVPSQSLGPPACAADDKPPQPAVGSPRRLGGSARPAGGKVQAVASVVAPAVGAGDPAAKAPTSAVPLTDTPPPRYSAPRRGMRVEPSDRGNARQAIRPAKSASWVPATHAAPLFPLCFAKHLPQAGVLASPRGRT